jgi:hypothetical protein
MSKVAKLVTISLMTRVIVDENASEEEILNSARPKFIQKVQEELSENLEEIWYDNECPYDPEFDNTLEPLVRQVVHDEDENTIPDSIQVGVYYYEDDETGKPVFDTDSMMDEFENELKKLENKFAS